MVEELEKLWSKLLFTEEEDEGIELGSSCTKAAKAMGKKLHSYEDSDHEEHKPRHVEEKLENALEAK